MSATVEYEVGVLATDMHAQPMAHVEHLDDHPATLSLVGRLTTDAAPWGAPFIRFTRAIASFRRVPSGRDIAPRGGDSRKAVKKASGRRTARRWDAQTAVTRSRPSLGVGRCRHQASPIKQEGKTLVRGEVVVEHQIKRAVNSEAVLNPLLPLS